jgi:hypothetical protein
MNNHKLQISELPATVQIPNEITVGLSLLFYEMGVDGNDVINQFIKYYIQRAREDSETLANICTNTGFSKHVVNKFIQESELKPSKKKKLYYRSLVQGLKDLSVKLKGEPFPIKGKFNSFLSVYNNCSEGEGKVNYKEISGASVCKRLIKVGILEDVDGRVRFLSSKQRVGCANMHTAMKEFACTIHRMAHTINHNLKKDNNEDTLFQASYFSTIIEPSKHSLVAKLLREKQRECFNECISIIDEHEESDPFLKKLTASKSTEIGVSFFSFNNFKTN